MQPGVEALLRLLVITAAVEVHDHHARFVAIGAVGEGADAREAPPGAGGIAFAVDEQMAGMGAVELVEHRLRREEARAFVQAAMPVAGNLAVLLLEIQCRQRRVLGWDGEHQVGNLDSDGLAFAWGKRPGPSEGFRLNSGRCVGQHLTAHVVAEPEQALVIPLKRFGGVAGLVSQRQGGDLR